MGKNWIAPCMRIPFSRAFAPLPDAAGRRRGGERGRRSCGDGGNQQRFARSLMRGRTPQSRVHPSGAETVKTLGRGERLRHPLFCRLLLSWPARYENCTLAIFILAAEQQQAANKHGTHNSVLPEILALFMTGVTGRSSYDFPGHVHSYCT